jgi:hypothetical protein
METAMPNVASFKSKEQIEQEQASRLYRIIWESIAEFFSESPAKTREQLDKEIDVALSAIATTVGQMTGQMNTDGRRYALKELKRQIMYVGFRRRFGDGYVQYGMDR